MASHGSFHAIYWILVTVVGGVLSDICYGPVCTYEWDVTISQTMRDSKNNLITLNGTQLQYIGRDRQPVAVSPDDVVAADGFIRDVILFNGKLPGPTIEVMKGVELVIKVNNRLRQKAIMVHWHGISQRGTYYMDGAEDITQCPIAPHTSFTYRFKAFPPGTHWYHSHQSMMRLDGQFGMLIVHDTPPEIPYFPIAVNDWGHLISEQMETTDPFLCENNPVSPPLQNPNVIIPDCSPEKADILQGGYTSSLFDGRNRWQNQPFPLKEYIVESGKRYRVRMVNAGHFFPFQIRIDQHPLTIVGTEGGEIQPIPVDSFFISVGDSFDFEFVADQPPGRYWFRADTECSGASAYGIIVYKGFEEIKSDPTSVPKSCTTNSPCTVFNCLLGRYPPSYNLTCIPLDSAKSTLPSQEHVERFGLGSSSPVHELFFNYGMNVGPGINARKFKAPREPLFQNQSAVSDCVGEPCTDSCKCSCTQIIDLPFNETIRLVISNLQPNRGVIQLGRHPAHMHGHEFAVLAVKYPEYDPITGRIVSLNSDITCESEICARPSWSRASPDFSQINNSVIKDTVVLPVGGYVVIQFVASNAGLWAFHCHIDQHMMGGMTAVFKVSHPKDGLPRVPDNFPTCSDFDEPVYKDLPTISSGSKVAVVAFWVILLSGLTVALQ